MHICKVTCMHTHKHKCVTRCSVPALCTLLWTHRGGASSAGPTVGSQHPSRCTITWCPRFSSLPYKGALESQIQTSGHIFPLPSSLLTPSPSLTLPTSQPSLSLCAPPLTPASLALSSFSASVPGHHPLPSPLHLLKLIK